MFAWQISSNWIPTKCNLTKHGLLTDEVCPICDSQLETTHHALWGCSSLADCRNLSDISLGDPLAVCPDFYDFIHQFLDPLPIATLELILVIMWRIWFRRNKKVHYDKMIDSDIVVSWGRDFLANYQRVDKPLDNSLTLGSSSSTLMGSSRSAWVPPTRGIVKINVDAALDTPNGRCGLGMVARDSTGDVIVSAVWHIMGTFTPEIAEALALKYAANQCRLLGFQNVWFEFDCLNVVLKFNNQVPLASSLGLVIADFRLSFSVFHSASLSFCARAFNTVAHSLAKYALSEVISKVWWPGYPSCIHDLILYEKN
ncbi:uncharacterized protein LOC133832691 [Humulus lupulus]|uniref:uncharacterized protein LOC133832691 n=1 Tax=Humulus lupulus TaxID=3486 RepID=UPI002B40DFEF|nr:uncharacterized protein LOC133832691 [Humulus lupulus]